ncbi:MAG: MATE family efflux transporter [Oscillospiraceae bacterium]|nr:MATE family efflux transporter [Oscillospiraceae bacterium]
MHKRVDLLNGSIPKALTQLALPIMATSLIQMAYNLTDMIWIGRIGAGAVAAIGAAGMFMWLSSGLVTLARMGGQVKVAQTLGAGDAPRAGKYAQCTLQMGLLFAVLYSLFLVFCTGPLIGFFNLNGAEVIANAQSYLRIVGLGMIFTFINQILTALITTTGNSKTPFIITTVGLAVNIVMDPVLIFGIGVIPALGVAGAAIATVGAQIIVTVLFLRYISSDTHLFCHVNLRKKPDMQLVAEITKISLPATLQNVLFPLIAMVVARFVAGFGDAAVAVQKVGSQIESISWMTADGFAMAINSFIAQNYGANNYARAKKGYYISLGIMTLWGVFCTAVLIFFAAPIFGFFIPDTSVLPMGIDYLVILGYSQLFMCYEIMVSGAFAGFGKTLVPAIVGVSCTALRIPMVAVLSATALGLCGVWWSLTISSILKGTIIFLLFFVLLAKLEKANKG